MTLEMLFSSDTELLARLCPSSWAEFASVWSSGELEGSLGSVSWWAVQGLGQRGWGVHFQGKVLAVCPWPGDLVHIRLGTGKAAVPDGMPKAREPEEKLTSAWKQCPGPSCKNHRPLLCFLAQASGQLGLSEPSKIYHGLCFIYAGAKHRHACGHTHTCTQDMKITPTKQNCYSFLNFCASIFCS